MRYDQTGVACRGSGDLGVVRCSGGIVGAMAVVVFRCGESLPAKGRGVL